MSYIVLLSFLTLSSPFLVLSFVLLCLALVRVSCLGLPLYCLVWSCLSYLVLSCPVLSMLCFVWLVFCCLGLSIYLSCVFWCCLTISCLALCCHLCSYLRPHSSVLFFEMCSSESAHASLWVSPTWILKMPNRSCFFVFGFFRVLLVVFRLNNPDPVGLG